MNRITNDRLGDRVWSFCVQIVGRGPLCRVVILWITISDGYIVIVVVRLLFYMVLISVNWLNDFVMDLLLTVVIVIVVSPRMLESPLL